MMEKSFALDMGKGVICKGLLFLFFFFFFPIVCYSQNSSLVLFPYEIQVGQELAGIQATFQGIVYNRMVNQEFELIPQQKVAQVLESNNIETLNVAEVQRLLRILGGGYGVYGTLTQQGSGFILKTLLVPAQGRAQEFTTTGLNFLELNIAVDAVISQLRGIIYKDRVLSSIIIRGNKHIGTEAILSRLPLSIGEIPTAKVIDEAVKALWAIGYFSDIKVHENRTPEGIQLEFTVVERPRITSIEIVGNEKLTAKDIRDVLVTRVGDVVNEQALSQEKQKIIAEYKKKGYFDATIEQQIIPEGNTGRAILRIVCNEGEELFIDRVVIKGAKTIKPGVLKKNLAIQKRVLLSYITGTGVLQEEYLERDTTVLHSELLNRGYFDAKVYPPKVIRGSEGITVEFTIVEGPRYKVGDISFKGDLLLSMKELEKLAEMNELRRKKEYFNYSVMQADANRIAQSYGRYGFAFADVIPVTKIDRETRTVSIVYTISRGEKVFIRKTILEGNEKTRDNVILRDLFLSDGDVYNSSLLEISRDKLARTGYFSNVDAEIIPTDSPSEIDLKIKVKEQSTGSFNFGVGFSTYSRFGISASLSERNFFGKGYYASLSASLSSKRSLFSLSFTNPRLYDTKLGLGFDLYNIADEYPEFTRYSTGGVVRISYPLGYYTTIYASYRLEFYSIGDVSSTASSLIRSSIGRQWGSTLSTSIVRNTTNSYSFPSRGTISSIGFEYGGELIGGDNNYIKLTGEYQYFQKIVEPEYVFHVKTVGNVLLPNGSGREIPIFERLFIGGIDSVRGYTIDDMSPYDVAGEAIGGIYSWYANLEFVWLMFPEFGVAFVPFYDVGLNYDPRYAHGVSALKSIKQSTGLEIRWQSPLGLLRLAYGYPLNRSTRDERLKGRFEFSIGSFF
ncbi:MAG: outer membrane protein assembly factor BamA [Desulfovibrionaceae bacterium]|nr:outer membrane protein assembly factor BamA [Desulfovibrionaceae bacterium]